MNDPIASRAPAPAELRREIEDLLLQIEGLVRVREILLRRGASDRELEEHSAHLGRLQWRLEQRLRAAGRGTRR